MNDKEITIKITVLDKENKVLTSGFATDFRDAENELITIEKRLEHIQRVMGEKEKGEGKMILALCGGMPVIGGYCGECKENA